MRSGVGGKCEERCNRQVWNGGKMSWRDLCEVELKGGARSGEGGNCGVRVKCEDGSWRGV